MSKTSHPDGSGFNLTEIKDSGGGTFLMSPSLFINDLKCELQGNSRCQMPVQDLISLRLTLSSPSSISWYFVYENERQGRLEKGNHDMFIQKLLLFLCWVFDFVNG